MARRRAEETGGLFSGEPGEALGDSILALAKACFDNLAELAAGTDQSEALVKEHGRVEVNMRAVEQSVAALTEYAQQSERFHGGMQEMCRHVIMVHATVLGLTVGLMGVSAAPAALLKCAVILMMTAVALGFALLGAQLRLHQRIAHRNFRLEAAAIAGGRQMALGDWASAVDWLLTSMALVGLRKQQLIEETAHRFGLSPKKYLEEATRSSKSISPAASWWLTWVFYLLSGLAFVLLLVSVTSR